MIADVNETAPDHIRPAEVEIEIERWEALMDTFQSRIPEAPRDVKWVAMELIFDLSDH